MDSYVVCVRMLCKCVLQATSEASLMFVVCFLVAGVLCKHIEHRNLFTQRMCCRRQSHFVYIGQGKAPQRVILSQPINLQICHTSVICKHKMNYDLSYLNQCIFILIKTLSVSL